MTTPSYRVKRLDEYQRLKKSYSRRRSEAEEQAEAIQAEMSQEMGDPSKDRGWMGQFRKHQNIAALDRSAVVSLIERILISRDRRLEVIYRWHDEFQHQMELVLQARTALSGREAV